MERLFSVVDRLLFFLIFPDMGRAMIALFITAFFFMFVSFTTGIVGCWRTSPSNITSSAILMLMACKYQNNDPAALMCLLQKLKRKVEQRIHESSSWLHNLEICCRKESVPLFFSFHPPDPGWGKKAFKEFGFLDLRLIFWPSDFRQNCQRLLNCSIGI